MPGYKTTGKRYPSLMDLKADSDRICLFFPPDGEGDPGFSKIKRDHS